MDDYHFSNNAKKNKNLYLIILGKIKAFNSAQFRHTLCNENKIVKI
jgi:hypothetical protein